MGGYGGENPWQTLRERPHLTLKWKRLPAGMGGMWRGHEIWLDVRLGRVERRCALMHELVHDERRIGWPFATEATMEREEAIVRLETAVRLVPLDQLDQLVAGRDGIEPITALVVAAEFDVTVGVATMALRALQRRHRARAEAVAASEVA